MNERSALACGNKSLNNPKSLPLFNIASRPNLSLIWLNASAIVSI
jgi:hypothetical protein